MPVVESTFTFDEFLYGASQPLPENHGKKYGRSSITGSEDFTGTESFEQAHHLALHGFPEGTKEMKKQMDLLGHAKANRLEPVFDVFGDEVEIGRFCSGDPENMVTFENVLKDGQQFLDVYVAFSYSYHKEARQIIKRGAIVLSNIDYLENNGFRCRIVGYNHALCRKDRRAKTRMGVKHLAILKDYNEPLDIDRMAFALACPSMLRRLAFRLTELLQPKQTNKNYGASHELLTSEERETAIDVTPFDWSEDEINAQFIKFSNPE